MNPIFYPHDFLKTLFSVSILINTALLTLTVAAEKMWYRQHETA